MKFSFTLKLRNVFRSSSIVKFATPKFVRFYSTASNQIPPNKPNSISADELVSALISRVGSNSAAQQEVQWIFQHFGGSKFDAAPFSAMRKALTDSSQGQFTLSPSVRSSIISSLQRRSEGVPLQYLLGDVEFCHYRFNCRPPILIPRTETEQITMWIADSIANFHSKHNQLSSVINENQAVSSSSRHWNSAIPYHSASDSFLSSFQFDYSTYEILDICSGSGCIGISLSSLLPGSSIIGIDIDERAIELARENQIEVETQRKRRFIELSQKSKKNTNHLPLPPLLPPLNCEFFPQDLFSLSARPDFVARFQHKFRLLVSNPPYLTSAEYNSPSFSMDVKDHESSIALVGGLDGLIFYREIIKLSHQLLIPIEATNQIQGNGAIQRILPPPELVMEIGGSHQVQPIKQLLLDAGFKTIQIFQDGFGVDRWVAAHRNSFEQMKNSSHASV